MMTRTGLYPFEEGMRVRVRVRLHHLHCLAYLGWETGRERICGENERSCSYSHLKHLMGSELSPRLKTPEASAQAGG
jgi:hypothetical protein